MRSLNILSVMKCIKRSRAGIEGRYYQTLKTNALHLEKLLIDEVLSQNFYKVI